MDKVARLSRLRGETDHRARAGVFRGALVRADRLDLPRYRAAVAQRHHADLRDAARRPLLRARRDPLSRPAPAGDAGRGVPALARRGISAPGPRRPAALPQLPSRDRERLGHLPLVPHGIAPRVPELRHLVRVTWDICPYCATELEPAATPEARGEQHRQLMATIRERLGSQQPLEGGPGEPVYANATAQQPQQPYYPPQNAPFPAASSRWASPRRSCRCSGPPSRRARRRCLCAPPRSRRATRTRLTSRWTSRMATASAASPPAPAHRPRTLRIRTAGTATRPTAMGMATAPCRRASSNRPGSRSAPANEPAAQRGGRQSGRRLLIPHVRDDRRRS